MNFSREELKKIHPKDIRALMRRQDFKDHTMGVAEGYVQANLAILPKKYAFDFMVFCQRNPKPCPILEVTEPGVSKLRYLSQEADLRSDLSQYRVFKNGECVDEPYDISHYWKDDFVAFLLGCSASFDHILVASNINVRHMQEGKIPSVYITNIQCNPAGPFKGSLVVTMRPIKKNELIRVIQITSRYPLSHGSPVHVGNPKEIGIEDIRKVDWGDQSEIEEDEVPVFWACGVTPQVICLNAKPEIMITHYPAKMFIADQLIFETALIG